MKAVGSQHRFTPHPQTPRPACRWAAAFCLVLGAAGCHAGWAPGRGLRTSEDTPARTAGPPAPLRYRYPDAPPVLDADGLRAFVGRFRHRVVLLDVWASWSRRSGAEMSELARWQARLGDDGFQVISCNLDDPSRWGTHTVATLLEAGGNFPCVVIRRDAKPALRAWLAPNWSYDLPARFLIDRRGRVVARALSGTPLASTRARVRRLLGTNESAARSATLRDGSR